MTVHICGAYLHFVLIHRRDSTVCFYVQLLHYGFFDCEAHRDALQGFYSDEPRTVMLYDHHNTTGDLVATGVEIATKSLSDLTLPTSAVDSAARALQIQQVRSPIQCRVAVVPAPRLTSASAHELYSTKYI